MKRILIAALALPSVLFFTSCIKDSDNVRFGYDFISTVIEKDAEKVVLTLDGGEKYYESSLLNSKSDNFEIGDRIYLNFLRINYSEQPDKAAGTKINPFFFSDIIYNKMNLVKEVENSDSYEEMREDAISYICQPYIQRTEIGNDYLNIFGELKEGAQPEFHLIYLGEDDNTLEYKLKVSFEKGITSSSKIVRFAKTFLLNQDIEDKKIKVEFNSKYYENNNKSFTSDSTFVVSY